MVKKMNRVFLMRLDQIQPSQLFINSKKLSQVMADSSGLSLDSIEPIPIKKLEKEVIFTDGHTRALAAYLCGIPEVSVFWDKDELNWEAYQICVKWCKEEGIYIIADLKDRVVSPEEYDVLWLKCCTVMHHDLKVGHSHDKHPDK